MCGASSLLIHVSVLFNPTTTKIFCGTNESDWSLPAPGGFEMMTASVEGEKGKKSTIATAATTTAPVTPKRMIHDDRTTFPLHSAHGYLIVSFPTIEKYERNNHGNGQY